MRKPIVIMALLAGLFLACEEILEVTDISEQQLTLLAPTDQSTVTDSIVNFNWDTLDEATAYQVQIATPNFTNAAQVLVDSTLVVDSTFVGPRITQKLLNQEYEWRVKALNSDFETPYATSRFTVAVPND